MEQPPTTTTTTTRVIKVDSNAVQDEELRDAVELLKAGEVVAFPTETVYGIIPSFPPFSPLPLL